MKCDLCDNEASTHEVTIRGGKKIERHLCESCAKKHGIDTKPSMPIAQMLTSLVMGQGIGATIASGPEAPKPVKCGKCGMTFADFKQHALVGCPECYTQMEAQLGPIIERAHEGATHHVGKLPRRALEASRRAGGGQSVEAILGTARERGERLGMLRKQLEEAIRAEQYERAARLRDEMRLLGGVQDAEETA